MGSRNRTAWIILTLVVAIVPLVARAGLGHRRIGSCGRCALPFASCHCAQPFCSGCQMAPVNCCCQAPVMQTQIVPQTTTILRQEQITTMQPVSRTEIRRQTQLVDVPVTTCRQVTVDEGTYQTVWVPKLTTRMVSETSVQKQVRYQDVPYQVVQHVPVTQTRVVPQQVTTYSQRSVMAAAPACNHGHDHLHSYIGSLSGSTIGIAAPVMAYDANASIGTLTPIPEPYAPVASVPMQHPAPPVASTIPNPPAPMSPARDPIASSSSGSEAGSVWSKVPSRAAADNGVQLQAYETEVRMESRPRSTHAFPSAAAVWQAQGAFSRN